MDRLDMLSVFVAVAERGSFIAAARQLGRSPTSVTRAVAMLEEQLAVRLLTRTTRAMSLTEAGQRCLAQGLRTLAEYAGLQNLLAAGNGQISGLLTLTAPEMFGRLHVLPVVQEFMRLHPLIDVALKFTNRVESFIDAGIDAGVRIAWLPDSSMRSHQLGALSRVVCASPCYIAARGEPLHPDDLTRHQTIAINGGPMMPDHWRFGQGSTELTIHVKPRLGVNNVQTALDAAVAGGGLVRLMSYQAAPLEASGQLIRVLAAYQPPPVPIHLVYPDGRHLPPKTRGFIDYAAQALRSRCDAVNAAGEAPR